MRKSLSIVSLLLFVSTVWMSISAAWVTGARKQAADIKVGDIIVLAAASTDLAVGHYLEGTQVVAAYSDDCPFEVVEGPTDFLGNPTIYLKQVSTGKYFGFTKLDKYLYPEENAMVDGTETAYPFALMNGDSCIVNAEHSPVLSTADEVVFRFNFKDADGDTVAYHLANWWGNLGGAPVWSYSDTAPWEVLEASEVKSSKIDLQNLVNKYLAEGLTFPKGDNPGFYDGAAADAFTTIFERAQVMVDETHTEEEYKVAYDQLIAAREAVEATLVPMSEGVYYFVSAYKEYFNKQKSYKAMYSTGNNMLWANIDSTNARYMFKVTKAENENEYIVECLGTNTFINTATGTSANIPMSDAFKTAQIFTPRAFGEWHIANTANTMDYHTAGHNDGAGVSGNIVTWNGGTNSASSWYIEKVDPSIVDAALKAIAQTKLTEALSDLVNKASADNDKNFVFDVLMDPEHALITNADDRLDDDGLWPLGQLSSNAKDPSEGSYGVLIDGKTEGAQPFFHSSYHASNDPKADHYLQADISNTPTQAFAIYWKRRMNNNSNRPTDITISVTNDTTNGGVWKEVKHIASGLPTAAADSEYVSPGIDCGAPYKYIRMTVHHTNTGGNLAGHEFFTLSEFQIYPFSISEALSQYYYVDGMKDASDALTAQLTQAKEKVANNTATQEDIDALQAAYDKMKSLFADTTEYVAKRDLAKRYVETAEVGDDFGFVNDASYITALQTAIDASAEGINFSTPTKAQLETAVQKLDDAVKAFIAGVKTIEPNKWYYILGSNTARAYAIGQAIYAGGASVDDNIKFGDYNAETDEVMYAHNPNAMWRFVPTEEPGVYNIQNLGTGHFMGKYAGISGLIKMTNEAAPFTVDYYSAGQMTIAPKDEATPANYGLHARESDMSIVTWAATAENNGSAWTFKEVDPELEMFAIKMLNNNVSIVTLPFAISEDLSTINDEVKTYAVKSLTVEAENSSLELTEKKTFEAGEPFVIVTGDCAAYDAENLDTIEVVFYPAFDIVTEAKTVNGLVGTLDGLTIKQAGYGYFTNATLTATTSAAYKVKGGSGYIDSKEVTTGTGNTDLTISCNGTLDAVKAVLAQKNNATVNVYSIDGVLLKKNVKVADATKGLDKGIYVVGEDKVAVK